MNCPCCKAEMKEKTYKNGDTSYNCPKCSYWVNVPEGYFEKNTLKKNKK